MDPKAGANYVDIYVDRLRSPGVGSAKPRVMTSQNSVDFPKTDLKTSSKLWKTLSKAGHESRFCTTVLNNAIIYPQKPPKKVEKKWNWYINGSWEPFLHYTYIAINTTAVIPPTVRLCAVDADLEAENRKWDPSAVKENERDGGVKRPEGEWARIVCRTASRFSSPNLSTVELTK